MVIGGRVEENSEVGGICSGRERVERDREVERGEIEREGELVRREGWSS